MESPADTPNRDLERYREYLGRLARLRLNTRLKGKVDLSGVVQQTMVEAYQALDMTQDWNTDQWLAWLRRILANNLADEIRKLGRHKRDVGRERSLEAALEESASRLNAFLAADQSSPSQRTVRHEQAVQLGKALAQLPETQREALFLQHWQGCSLNEIAQQMEKTPAAVAGLIKRALKQLRTHLEERE
jgi:RNA polymerase sigma-70 factor (ECF subfamily)